MSKLATAVQRHFNARVCLSSVKFLIADKEAAAAAAAEEEEEEEEGETETDQEARHQGEL